MKTGKIVHSDLKKVFPKKGLFGVIFGPKVTKKGPKRVKKGSFLELFYVICQLSYSEVVFLFLVIFWVIFGVDVIFGPFLYVPQIVVRVVQKGSKKDPKKGPFYAFLGNYSPTEQYVWCSKKGRF
jgi:hypothetical protein